jgi:hypothetical protein
MNSYAFFTYSTSREHIIGTLLSVPLFGCFHLASLQLLNVFLDLSNWLYLSKAKVVRGIWFCFLYVKYDWHAVEVKVS